MKKGSILADLPAVSQAQCYSRKDLEVLFQCSEDTIAYWINNGLIRGIKTGKKLVFPEFEVLRFQREMLGEDISNLERIIEVRKRHDQCTAHSHHREHQSV